MIVLTDQARERLPLREGDAVTGFRNDTGTSSNGVKAPVEVRITKK